MIDCKVNLEDGTWVLFTRQGIFSSKKGRFCLPREFSREEVIKIAFGQWEDESLCGRWLKRCFGIGFRQWGLKDKT